MDDDKSHIGKKPIDFRLEIYNQPPDRGRNEVA
jgi:hypothetical protein